MNIENILLSGGVLRFHNVPGLKCQTVADHSWGTAMLIDYLHGDAPKRLMLSALTHDCALLETGDIPESAKWKDPTLHISTNDIAEGVNKAWGIHSKLTIAEERILEVCSALESVRYCVSRFHCGERAALKPLHEYKQHLISVLTMESLEREYLVGLLSEVENY